MFSAKWSIQEDGGLNAYVIEDSRPGEIVAQSVMYPVLGQKPALRITRLDHGEYEELLLRLMIFKAQEMGINSFYISAPDANGAFLAGFGFKKELLDGHAVYFADERTLDMTSACHKGENK